MGGVGPAEQGSEDVTVPDSQKTRSAGERARCGNSSHTSAGSWGRARGGRGVGMGCLPARRAAGPSSLNCRSEMLTAAHSPSARRRVGAKARQGGCAGPGTSRPRGGPGRKGPQLSLPGKPSQSCYFGGQKPSPSPGPPPAGAQGGPSTWGRRWHTCPPAHPPTGPGAGVGQGSHHCSLSGLE